MIDSVPSAAATGSSALLSGVRVLDLSAYIAGPYGCSLLADVGFSEARISEMKERGTVC